MKKMVFTKLLCVAAAMFIGVGTFGQTHDGSTVPAAGVVTYAASTAEGTTYIMEGTTVPMYALPDPYYHPNYDVANAVYTLTNGFTWTFSGTATTSLTVTQAATNDNYVTVAAPAASEGNYVLTVVENAPAALGGCSGLPVNLNITVVPEPELEFDAALDLTAGAYSFCEGNTGFPTEIQTLISGGWQNFRLAWSLEIATLDEDGAKEFYYDDELGTNPLATPKFAEEYTEAVPQAIANVAAAPDIMTVTDFLTIDNGTREAVTVYTYTLNSINDQASRFGDFIDLDGDASDASAFTYYGSTSTLVVTVYPAPTTGPIYHIPNNWAN